MRLPHRFIRAARFAAWLAAGAAWLAPGLRAQSNSGEYANMSELGNFMNRTNSTFNSGLSSSSDPAPLPLYFPPDPPPLDQIVARNSPGYRRMYQPPAEVAPYVNEQFYPELAARLDHRTLSERQRRALESYHDEKVARQQSLRAQLDSTLRLEPAARAAALADFAAKPAAPLAALERRADDIRGDLFDSDYAFNAARKPFITDTLQRTDYAEDVLRVMLGAAFFQKGLSPAQRTLLREIALELTSAAASADDALAAQPYLFFSPGLSRVLLPDDPPADVAAKLAAFQSKKSALRKELYDAVYHEDATWFGLTRTLRLKSLADRQAPEFAALENLAEEIRRALPPLPPAAPLPLTALAPELAERVSDLFLHETTESDALNREFEKDRANDPALRIITAFNSGRRRYELHAIARYPSSAKEFERARVRADELMGAYDRVDAVLTGERNAIRREIAASLGTEDPARIDRALAEGVRRAMEEKSAAPMRDYRTAVLEPGLSAAQRRLLFDYAVEHLELPLPAGVLQPKQRLLQPVSSADH